MQLIKNFYLNNKAQVLILVVIIILVSLGLIFVLLMPISYQVIRVSNLLDSFQAKAYSELAYQILIVYIEAKDLEDNDTAIEILQNKILVNFNNLNFSSSSCGVNCTDYTVNTTGNFNNWPKSGIEIKWRLNGQISNQSYIGIFRNSRYIFLPR